MDALFLILLFFHVLGFAALIGGLLAQVGDGEKRVNAPMRDGAGTAFLAGLALTGVAEAGDGDVNHVKIAAKLVVGLVILVLVMANMRKPSIPNGLFYALLLLAVLNVGIALFVSPAHV